MRSFSIAVYAARRSVSSDCSELTWPRSWGIRVSALPSMGCCKMTLGAGGGVGEPAPEGRATQIYYRADYRLAPRQWETLQSNTISHWLGTNIESALILHNKQTEMCQYWMGHYTIIHCLGLYLWNYCTNLSRDKDLSLFSNEAPMASFTNMD